MTTAAIPKRLTAADLLAMPDDGKRYELIRGELIAMPSPGIMHGIITDRISGLLRDFVRRRGLGFLCVAEAGIYIEQMPDTVRAADFSLISYDRIAGPLPERGYAPGLIPDLVVEVVSPDYPRELVDSKIQMWRDAGVRLVLVAYIARREIAAHHANGAVQRFGINDTLTGAPVLPGFACAVADIFTY